MLRKNLLANALSVFIHAARNVVRDRFAARDAFGDQLGVFHDVTGNARVF